MKITECKFKDVPAICAETDKIKAVFLPKNGCRLQSIVDKASGRELLALDGNSKFIPQTPEGIYVNADVSGCDDMFPTIDPMKFGFGTRAGINYPCHGEVCRVAHSCKIQNNGFSTEFVSEKLFYRYEKKVYESLNGGITVGYSIVNTSDDDFHCMWAAHFMASAEEGGYAVVPYKEGAPAEIMFDEKREFADRGDVIKVDRQLLTSRKFSPSANAYKLFFRDVLAGGEVGYFLPSIKRRLMLRFDPKKLPYLGIWVNNGAFKGMYSMALEVATAPYDRPDEAMRRGIDFVIPPGEAFDFELTVEIE